MEISDSEDKTLFELLDLSDIKSTYSDAWNCFVNHIHFKEFDTTVVQNELLKIKEGFFLFLEDSRDRDRYLPPSRRINFQREIKFVSLQSKPLEILMEFYHKLGKIYDSELMPVYSPEEEVFSPYFTFLGKAYEKLILNQNSKRIIGKVITEYKDRNFNNYSHTVSTISLIVEDYLIQIYETLFRKIHPKNLTLGELYGLIHREIELEFGHVRLKKPDPKEVYESIKNLSTISNIQGVHLSKPLFKIIDHLTIQNRYMEEKVQGLTNNKQEKSVFPFQIRENINELIKYRNATAHKSNIPIGNYEALRTIYCCMTLILWWTKEKKMINWNEEREIILKKMIENSIKK